MKTEIAVLGAGVIGLSTAVCLQEKFPTIQVTVISEKVNYNTTSYGAAGGFRVDTDNFDTASPELLDRLCRDSFAHFWALANSEESAHAGAHVIPFIECFNNDREELPLYTKYVHGYQTLNKMNLQRLGFPKHCVSGLFCMTTMTECRRYLPYLSERFAKSGGKFVQRKLENLHDVINLSSLFSIVVNCTGLGSMHLFNDTEMYPVRGQLVRVKAPWIKLSMNAPQSTYRYVGQDSVVLGGFRQRDDWDLRIRVSEREDIIARAVEYMPSLKGAKIVEEWVGLRPHRKLLRIEIDHLATASGSRFPVVHNYGHGAHGVALSWGSAMEVSRLIQGLLMTERSKL